MNLGTQDSRVLCPLDDAVFAEMLSEMHPLSGILGSPETADVVLEIVVLVLLHDDLASAWVLLVVQVRFPVLARFVEFGAPRWKLSEVGVVGHDPSAAAPFDRWCSRPAKGIRDEFVVAEQAPGGQSNKGLARTGVWQIHAVRVEPLELGYEKSVVVNSDRWKRPYRDS